MIKRQENYTLYVYQIGLNKLNNRKKIIPSGNTDIVYNVQGERKCNYEEFI